MSIADEYKNIFPSTEYFNFELLPQETKDAVIEIEQMIDDPERSVYETSNALFEALDI